MKKILISGYYGFGNSGDDALLMSVINEFERKGLKEQIVVLSNNPAETKKTYGVKSVYRMNPFLVLYNIIFCGLFISGGGTLIQDGTSTKSLMYYLTLIRFAKLFGKKVMLYANGIGPVFVPQNRIRCKKVLNTVDVITVRDKKSEKELEKLGITKPEIILTADPVFLLKTKENADGIFKKYKIPHEYICVAIRSPKPEKRDFADSVAKALDRAEEEFGVKAVLLPLQEADLKITETVSQKMKSESIVIEEHLSPGAIMELVSGALMCVGMRLHMLIYAAAKGVPIVGIVYDPKVSGFMEYAEQTLYTGLEDMNSENLYALICECMKNRDLIRENLSEVRNKLVVAAGKNTDAVMRLYGAGKGISGN